MAKLTWTIETIDGTVAQDGPTLAEDHMERFIDWLWIHYPQVDIDGEGVETPKPRNTANESQAFRDWADVQYEGTKANVLRHEKDVAAKAGRDGVADII